MATVTVRLNSALEEKLSRLADGTSQSPSRLAIEAIQTYVDHQLKIIDGINCGLEDMKQGSVVPHDLAMDEIDALID